MYFNLTELSTIRMAYCINCSICLSSLYIHINNTNLKIYHYYVDLLTFHTKASANRIVPRCTIIRYLCYMFVIQVYYVQFLYFALSHVPIFDNKLRILNVQFVLSVFPYAALVVECCATFTHCTQ